MIAHSFAPSGPRKPVSHVGLRIIVGIPTLLVSFLLIVGAVQRGTR